MKKDNNRCAPHSWKLPVPGDVELECVQCGRRLHWYFDITPNIMAAIVNSIERHQPAPAYEFQGFFGYGPLREAFKAARPPVEIPEGPRDQRRDEASYDTPAPPTPGRFPDRRGKQGQA